MASDASGSDDEFVVVIPDCFNLELPLTANSPDPSRDLMTRSCEEFEYMTGSHDQSAVTNDVMTQSHDSSVAPPSEPVTNPATLSPPQDSAPRPKPNPQTPPTSEPKATLSAGTSPRTGRRSFVPERVTLRDVKDARLTNPLTVATGLVNTVAHLVEGFTIRGKKKTTTSAEKDGGEAEEEEKKVNEGGREQQEEEQEEEEAFVVSVFVHVGLFTCVCGVLEPL